MDKDRLEILLYIAIDLLLAGNSRADVLDNLGMTLDEYSQVMGEDAETDE